MFKLYNHFFNDIGDLLEDYQFVKKTKKIQVMNVASVFDIEASSFYVDNSKQACMYAWVFGINGKCIRGRTWDEFINTLNIITKCYGLDINKRLIVYVHNLSYEFQWFKKYFQWYKVFSVENRKPVYAITKTGIEFRCSYLLSGYSLAKLGENLVKYKVQKMVGDLDYELIRTSITPLTDKEWGYVLNDGLVVMAYIQEEIERMETIAKLPITKTGYVRLLLKEKCIVDNKCYNYSKFMKNLTLEEDIYKELKRVYVGGYTHANHNYVGKELTNIASFDFTSSYPTVMVSEKFPMSKPVRYRPKSYQDFKEMLNKYNCMFDITFYNLTSKVNFEHYISRSKCGICENYVLDNGRIVEATKLQTSITELDYFVIEKVYEWEKMEIGNFNFYYSDYLPKEIITSILELYKNKTSLKGVEGKETEYLVSKGMINAVYGCTVTDPCRDEIVYDNENDWQPPEKCDVGLMLAYYNRSNTRFLYYPWGIWITAYARYNLWTGILEFKDDYVYSDTDSLKVFNYENHLEYINKYNEFITKKINKCLHYYNISCQLAKPKTIKGVEKPLGVWDFEGVYNKFKTLGAKRYMYSKDNQLNITISGVNKEKGVEYLMWKYKTIDRVFKNFNDNLCFPRCYHKSKNDKTNYSATGKLVHTYIDGYISGEITDYLGNVGEYREMSAVHMEPTDYNLSLADNFKRYLLGEKVSWIC